MTSSTPSQHSTSSSAIAVVTGGTAGLGRAIVRELASRGYDVAILARGQEGLDGAVHDVTSMGRRALGISTDVADVDAVEAAASRVESELGPIDVWVNDAMVGVFGEFISTDPKDFERAFDVNFFGFVNGTRAALRRMQPRNSGTIVQIGSALAHRGIPLQASYCAAKHAITGFNESVLTELLHQKSKVTLSQVDMPAMNTIQFNWVKSQLPAHPQPVAPIYQPEICAKVVVDVAQKPRRRTWVGEPTVATTLGNRFGSRIADWYLAKSGYSGQQAPDVTEPMLGTNLYEPIAGDHGARGAFSSRSLSGSPQIWAIRNRTAAYTAAAGVALAIPVIGAVRRAMSR
ncbi:SDR family oxidoreductase [Naasia lichenicola]|uniref:SDR family NAD(P)-dependent oxidoreductase n=1 Tax=Naasia lichenicola TaxID=2565933 RepID=A0A4S4FL54_9MICO|nr:SDR family oxidoreductase [Naasia lichenicola]THG29916.1 SDR family NAD(P)-dependent oxidoreductase [Naasia lichenicola]